MRGVKEWFLDLFDDIVNGEHGPYIVTTPVDISITGSITCSLAGAWIESRRPKKGEHVILSDFTKMPAGWRANFGRFMRPSDEHETSNQHQASSKESRGHNARSS